MENFSFTAIYHPECGYTVKVNGEIILECLSPKELKELSLEEIVKIYKETR